MNCVLIVVDSMSYRRIRDSRLELIPNIKKYSENGISCENVYALAPFTESAAMSLYCGQNTLDRHGYMERFRNAEKTLTEVFQENGYDVYYGDLVPALYPSSLYRGVDTAVYDRGYDIWYLWHYRLSYYRELYKNEMLTEQDFKQLERLMDDNFAGWLRMTEDMLHEKESVGLLKRLNKSFDSQAVKEMVIKERDCYEADRQKYLERLMEQGEKHALFSIPFFSQKDYQIDESVEHIYRNEAKKLCRKVMIKNFLRNIVSNKDIYLKTVERITKGAASGDETLFELIRNTLFIRSIRMRYRGNIHGFKGQPSFQRHIDHLLGWIDGRKGQDRPYFAFLHVDDIHFPETFYSYDINEKKILRDEIRYARDNLKKLSFFQPGTVSTDLSILHADHKFGYFMREMEKRGQVDDTVFFITADHGFSYSHYPIRSKYIHTFFLENFHIPFFAFGKNVKKAHIKTLQSSLDIPCAVCDIMGFDIPASFAGSVIGRDEGKNEDGRMLTIEYCGGGCPDLSRRKMMIAAFDREWMVAAEIRKNEVVSSQNVTEIYNLKKDPEQRKNLNGRVSLKRLKKYCMAIQKRVDSIRETDIQF